MKCGELQRAAAVSATLRGVLDARLAELSRSFGTFVRGAEVIVDLFCRNVSMKLEVAGSLQSIPGSMMKKLYKTSPKRSLIGLPVSCFDLFTWTTVMSSSKWPESTPASVPSLEV